MNRPFPTTAWTIVRNAQRARSAIEVSASLTWLFEMYRYPLYAFIRRSGVVAEAAEDVLQTFFAEISEPVRWKHLMEKSPAESGGRFRTFLIWQLRATLKNIRERDGAIKRGGTVTHFSLNVGEAEERYAHEPVDPATPEDLLTLAIGEELSRRVLARLREKHGNRFQSLMRQLEASAPAHREAAAGLGLSENAFRQACSRFRADYRDLLLAEARALTDSPDDVEDELRRLLATQEKIRNARNRA